MRRITILSLLFLVLTMARANPVLAQNAHFIGTATVSGVFSDGGISVKFKEAGVGSNVSITYSLCGSGVVGTPPCSSFIAHYGCINRGGNHPKATNKTGVKGPADATMTMSSGKNGTITGTLPFTPPDPNTVLTCPGSQVAVLADIAYSDLSLTDTTNTVDATLSATALSATFFTF